jgi:hypothetical protein
MDVKRVIVIYTPVPFEGRGLAVKNGTRVGSFDEKKL